VACVIRVQGKLDPRWSERLGGLQLTVSDSAPPGDGVTSELRGELLDQAALLGVLTTLNDLRLPLLGVTCKPAPPTVSTRGDVEHTAALRQTARTAVGE
jgi:hypothetical protein